MVECVGFSGLVAPKGYQHSGKFDRVLEHVELKKLMESRIVFRREKEVQKQRLKVGLYRDLVLTEAADKL